MPDRDTINRLLDALGSDRAVALVLSMSPRAGELVARELVEAQAARAAVSAGRLCEWSMLVNRGRTAVLDQESRLKAIVRTNELEIRGVIATVVLDVLSTPEMRESARIAVGRHGRWLRYEGALADLGRETTT